MIAPSADALFWVPRELWLIPLGAIALLLGGILRARGFGSAERNMDAQQELLRDVFRRSGRPLPPPGSTVTSRERAIIGLVVFVGGLIAISIIR